MCCDKREEGVVPCLNDRSRRRPITDTADRGVKTTFHRPQVTLRDVIREDPSSSSKNLVSLSPVGLVLTVGRDRKGEVRIVICVLVLILGKDELYKSYER